MRLRPVGLGGVLLSSDKQMLLWFDESSMENVSDVGGKGASLGEMYRELTAHGVSVPNGFSVTVNAYHAFVDSPIEEGCWNGVSEVEDLPGLREKVVSCSTLRKGLHMCLEGANQQDHLEMLARCSLARNLIEESVVPEVVREAIYDGYLELCYQYGPGVDVAVRSSATVEDSAEASFAGQYESYLNVHGTESVILHWKRCVASLFTERAVAYQIGMDMDPLAAALAVVVMKMVRSDLASSGVIFTIDPDSGHEGIIHITSSYGLGELIVQGTVSPDGYLVWKDGLRRGHGAVVHRRLGSKEQRMVYADSGQADTAIVDVAMNERKSWSLSREEALELARMADRIELHYEMPMDIEWAKDGISGELFIVQARPETVHARASTTSLLRYVMDPMLVAEMVAKGGVVATGQAVGKRIGSGPVRCYRDYEEVITCKRALRDQLGRGENLEEMGWEERVFEQGDVLVTEMTTPDWEPMMKQASLIVTRKGGRTSHAAIIAREFGIPAIVGCTDATKLLETGMEVTGSCAEGDVGAIYSGIQPFEIETIEIDTQDKLDTKLKLNVGFPTKSLADSMLPVDGVGLARIEFVLTAEVGIHPLSLAHTADLATWLESGEAPEALIPFEDGLERAGKEYVAELLSKITNRTAFYDDPRDLFIDKLKEGIGLICAAFHPRPVLVRLSDLKSNEYRELAGGMIFEPVEENPMIAWRGAARYVDPKFSPAFEMECAALHAVKNEFGLDNLQLMIPFCRSPEEGVAVKGLLDSRGIGRADGVPLFIMVELPSNVIEAQRFIDEMELDGASIGTNDLVQTVYAVSRDDLEGYLHPVDARSPAVKSMVRNVIATFRKNDLEIGICGQAPSDHPEEFPPFLIECGITSISVTPDTAIAVRMAISEAEDKQLEVLGAEGVEVEGE